MFTTTVPFVNVQPAWLVIHSVIVSKKLSKRLNADPIRIARPHWLVSMKNVEIHAPNVTRALRTLNVEYLNIDLSATVQKDGEEIHKLSAINV